MGNKLHEYECFCSLFFEIYKGFDTAGKLPDGVFLSERMLIYLNPGQKEKTGN